MKSLLFKFSIRKNCSDILFFCSLLMLAGAGVLFNEQVSGWSNEERLLSDPKLMLAFSGLMLIALLFLTIPFFPVSLQS
ncbi:hypothetical protein ACSLBF_15360 [Pseudoalteromonas sp. T1lg65]|uniref:hypothetical protein n=1 Tax=Pseudoalteromonas sp. T1lg65 TaxID=2077101 RepID=UPI003F78C241